MHLTLEERRFARLLALENIVADIKGALATDEDGAALVEVARAAAKAERELARIESAEPEDDLAHLIGCVADLAPPQFDWLLGRIIQLAKAWRNRAPHEGPTTEY